MRCWTCCQSSSEIIRSLGAGMIFHSCLGRGRRTRLFVPGTFTFLLLFHTIFPRYSSRRIISRIAEGAHVSYRFLVPGCGDLTLSALRVLAMRFREVPSAVI